MLYSIGLFLYMVAASPFYLARVLRGRYRSSFRERMGWDLARVDGPSVWLHACSVGEVEAALPLVELIRRDAASKEAKLIVSTVTETGHARAVKLFPDAIVRYLPYDFLSCVRRHLDTAESLSAFFIMETEIWPNLIGELDRRGVPVFIANGRISDRAWPRYERFAALFRPVLAKVAAVAARTGTDAERFRFLGALCVAPLGNIKFDREPAPPPPHPPAGRFVVFGSTHPGEEEICLAVFRNLRRGFPELRAIVAPRHIERAGAVASSCNGALRSRSWGNEDVLILDTHGELAGMYAVADAAFIGGSFVSIGGHNPIEAAIHGIPVLWGPHVANFREACALLEGNGGFAIGDAAELESALRRLLEDRAFRDAEGAKAREVILANRGATERHWHFFGLDASGAAKRRPLPAGKARA